MPFFGISHYTDLRFSVMYSVTNKDLNVAAVKALNEEFRIWFLCTAVCVFNFEKSVIKL